jgi:cobalt-zinc-cadmium efflux system protein
MAHEHPHLHPHETTRAAVHRLALALVITLVFVAAEVVVGIISHSLALVTDAAHNFTDAMALGLTWWALTITLKPAHSGKTYGYHRAGILVALFNSTTLALIAVGIFVEGIRRLLNPPEIRAGLVIWGGVLAIAVNLITAMLVRRGSKHDLNLKSAYLHLMGDVLSTFGAVIAGVIILLTGANWVDPLVSILIGFLILWNAWGIVRESVEILMESTPRDVNMAELVKAIKAVPGVHGVHDLHVWSLTKSMYTLSAHIVTDDLYISQGARVQGDVSRLLSEKFKIAHATLQLECPGCASPETYCKTC